MKFVLYQTIKDGVELKRGKEIKLENCSFATSNTCNMVTPTGYSEPFKGLKTEIYQKDRRIFELYNPQIELNWKTINIRGFSSIFTRGKIMLVIQEFYGNVSLKNEEEK